MRILILGDSYFPSDAYRPSFASLAARHEVQYADVIDDLAWVPASAS